MKATPIITSFNGGELSPLMQGRPDLKTWSTSCRRLRNFIPTTQGPARRRAGTRFVAEVKTSTDRTWLAVFKFNEEQTYVLEFGNLYCRFYSSHGVVGAPFELVTPWFAPDLIGADGTFQLRFAQSGDVLYVAYYRSPLQKIVRTSSTTFTIAPVDLLGGPFDPIVDQSRFNVPSTYYSDARTGATNFHLSAIDVWDIGDLIRLESKTADDIKQWEPGKTIAAGDIRRSDGKNYIALNSATTGTIRPIHGEGARYDGSAGVQWDFRDPGYGWAIVTATTVLNTTVPVFILSPIPDNCVGIANKTTKFAYGAWSLLSSAGQVFPNDVFFHKERLCLVQGRRIWGSVAGDFENFRDRDSGGLVTEDSGFLIDITSDQANEIVWVSPQQQALMVGTGGTEHAIYETVSTDPFGPGNISVFKQSGYGARHTPVFNVGDGTLFVQKSGRRIRDMGMAESINTKWIAKDLTVLSDHFTKSGIYDMAYQQNPDSVVWSLTMDGRLSGLTLQREQEVHGWHGQRIGGYSDASNLLYANVESIVCVPSPDGSTDELWMIVARRIKGLSGTVHRYVEWMEVPHERGDDPEDAFYVDCGLTFDGKINSTLVPDTTIGHSAVHQGDIGVNFFAAAGPFVSGSVGKYIHYRYTRPDITGKPVWYKAIALITTFTNAQNVLATIISPWPETLIPGGGGTGTTPQIAATLWRMTATVITGLGHLEGELVDILADGIALAQQRVVSGSVTLAVAASKVHVGLPCPAVLQPMPIEGGNPIGSAQGMTRRISKLIIRFDETGGALFGRDELGTNVKVDRVPAPANGDLFTGDKVVDFPDGYEGDGVLTILQDKPLPCTVVAIIPVFDTAVV